MKWHTATTALFLWFTSLPCSASGLPALRPHGQPIVVPFPNAETMMGLGGLSYDPATEVWTAPAENIYGTQADEGRHPLSFAPRLYRFMLNFTVGSLTFASPAMVRVQSTAGLKLEDIEGPNPDGSFWVVSEAHSHYKDPNEYLSKAFGVQDLNNFDPDTFEPSKLLRVSAQDGKVLEVAETPVWAKWDHQHHWDAQQCMGDRVFQGQHAISFVPSGASDGSGTMIVGMQAALYQDGSTPTEFEGSRTRLLFYSLDGGGGNTSGRTASYSRAYRYDTSHKTMKKFQKGAKHFNALFGLLALNESSLFAAECEDLHGFGVAQVINRIFHVELDPKATVDHCASLLDCDVAAPKKRLLWEQTGELQLDGLGWGPAVAVDGKELPTVALVFENDYYIGARFELLVFDEVSLYAADTGAWHTPPSKEALLWKRTSVVLVSLSVLFVVVLAQMVLVFRRRRHAEPSHIVSDGGSTAAASAVIPWGFSHYLLGTCIANSFLVGGLTFGFPGMVLILRKEGHYAGSCACGTFCSGEKEQLALVSTMGFAVAIGSRILLGLFLDTRGPKATALVSCAACLAAFLVVALAPVGNLAQAVLPAWLLLCLGGSGLHLAGFHAASLFHGTAKTAASAGISAGFGASSMVFPAMQALSQYAHVGLQEMAAAYAVVVFLVGINNFLVQPWDKVQAGVPLVPDVRFWRSAWWRRAGVGRPMLVGVPEIVRRFDFWGEALFYSVSMLLMTHYLSTLAQLMHEKGDVPFTNNPNDWTDYMFTRLAGLFNSLGFLWFPFVEWFMGYHTWTTCFVALFVSNAVLLLVILVPVLEVQVFGMLLQSIARLMLFSFHHAYLLDKFGIEYFGVLNGLASLLAATIGLLSYPLQLLAVSFLGGSFALSFVPVGVFFGSSIAFPFLLHRRPVSNWAETAYVDPRKFRRPTSVEAVVAEVRKADKVRCAGAMHSCAPLIASEGIILSLERLDQILEIDTKRQVARFQAGVTVHQLCEALAPHGLALGTLGTIDWQKVVGAVMTGTHGGSLTTPSLHAFMEAYTMVKASGEVVEVRRDADPDFFSAMAPSMGVMGVVVEAEMRCVPLQHLEARLEAMPAEDLPKCFEEIMTKNKYARVVVYPTIGQATVWTANPVARPGDAAARGAVRASGYVNFRDEREKSWLEDFLRLSKQGRFELADEILRKVLASQLQRLAHYEGQYNYVLCKERNHGIPHADMEFGFDFAKNREVLEAALGYCKQHRMPYYNFELRATQQDDAMLSCCYGRDTMWIDFQAKAGDNWAFFGAMEDLFMPIGYRKHWAKGMDHTNPEYIMQQFPMLGDFLCHVEKLDPEGKFQNEHVQLWLKAQSRFMDLPEKMSVGFPQVPGGVV